MGHAAKEKKAKAGSELAASSRFKSFGPEHEQEVRQAQIKSDPIHEALIKAWDDVKKSPVHFSNYFSFHISKSLEGIKYSAKDVEKFSLIMHRFQDQDYFAYNYRYDMGFFISRLAYDCRDQRIAIHTGNLDKPLDYLGYSNHQELIVHGDAGNRIGKEMYGGKLVIEGNAGFQAGSEMTGGTIIIRGDAGNGVGLSMRGGEIHLEGAYETISECIEHGKIYHKGKLILKK